MKGWIEVMLCLPQSSQQINIEIVPVQISNIDFVSKNYLVISGVKYNYFGLTCDELKAKINEASE